jgi:hypothetical protein
MLGDVCGGSNTPSMAGKIVKWIQKTEKEGNNDRSISIFIAILILKIYIIIIILYLLFNIIYE